MSCFAIQSMTTLTQRRRLRVRFILPALTEATSPYWRPVKYSLFPPLGLATLAAYLRPDDEATIIDEHVEPLREGEGDPDLVVIQVYITNAYRAYGLADCYRARGVFFALGGLHVTSMPAEAALHADAIFLGPGEQTFPLFLDEFRRGTPQRLYRSTSGRTIQDVPPIRRDLIRRRNYLVPNSDRNFPLSLDEFRRGTPQRLYRSTSGRTSQDVPPIRRDLIRRRNYLVPN